MNARLSSGDLMGELNDQLIESAVEFEVLEFCNERCHCSHQGVSAFIPCTKCLRTAKGFLLDRRNSASRLLDIGHIKFTNGNGWSLTTSGEIAYKKVRDVMDKIGSSAGLFMTPSQKQAHAEETRLRLMLSDVEQAYGATIQKLRLQLTTIGDVRADLGLPDPPRSGNERQF